MDVSTITDIKELKAMAYDQIAAKEQVQRNLNAINQRITEVAQAEDESKLASAKKLAARPEADITAPPAAKPSTAPNEKPEDK